MKDGATLDKWTCRLLRHVMLCLSGGPAAIPNIGPHVTPTPRVAKTDIHGPPPVYPLSSPYL